MKSILFISIVFLLLAACNNSKNKKNIVLGENYGQVIVDTSEAITVSEMLTSFKSKTGKAEYTIKGEITEICLNAGCWININKGNGETFMVRFKDHFTIPTKTKTESQAFIHGIAFFDTISVELLQHYAEDAGKSKEEISKIRQIKYEFGFEADGITLIKDN